MITNYINLNNIITNPNFVNFVVFGSDVFQRMRAIDMIVNYCHHLWFKCSSFESLKGGKGAVLFFQLILICLVKNDC